LEAENEVRLNSKGYEVVNVVNCQSYGNSAHTAIEP